MEKINAGGEFIMNKKYKITIIVLMFTVLCILRYIAIGIGGAGEASVLI